MPGPVMSLVVFHSPGPKWPEGGLDLSDPQVQAHAAHFGKEYEAGNLELGGPHPGHGGGMMVFKPGVDEAHVRTVAEDDPAVRAGIISYEVRPWVRVYDVRTGG